MRIDDLNCAHCLIVPSSGAAGTADAHCPSPPPAGAFATRGRIVLPRANLNKGHPNAHRERHIRPLSSPAFLVTTTTQDGATYIQRPPIRPAQPASAEDTARRAHSPPSCPPCRARADQARRAAVHPPRRGRPLRRAPPALPSALCDALCAARATPASIAHTSGARCICSATASPRIATDAAGGYSTGVWHRCLGLMCLALWQERRYTRSVVLQGSAVDVWRSGMVGLGRCAPQESGGSPEGAIVKLVLLCGL